MPGEGRDEGRGTRDEGWTSDCCARSVCPGVRLSLTSARVRECVSECGRSVLGWLVPLRSFGALVRPWTSLHGTETLFASLRRGSTLFPALSLSPRMRASGDRQCVVERMERGGRVVRGTS